MTILYTHALKDKDLNRIISSIITPNPAGENPVCLPLQNAYHHQHQNMVPMHPPT